MKFKVKKGRGVFVSWYLIPTIRVGLLYGRQSGFIALTWLQADFCVYWERT